MKQYRIAIKKDLERIAHLHAVSWQQNYHKALSKNYLENFVEKDRLNVWQKRFATSNPDQHVIVAEENNLFVGFACTYLNEDPICGALLDNLHVYKNHQGKGIGKELMNHSARWVFEKDPNSKFYLWVLAVNKSAFQFYLKLGGKEKETVSYKMPDGNFADAIRIVWNDIKPLIYL